MKTLYDICLTHIATNLNAINRVGSFLAPVHKETLIERLGYHDMFTSDYLPLITYNLFSALLKRITFKRCVGVTDAVLKQLGLCGCKLHHLTIDHCKSVTDVGIEAVTKGQNELQSLELQKLPSLTWMGLRQVQSDELTKVDISGCLGITTQGLQIFLSRNKNIKHLVLATCTKLDDSAIICVAEALKNKLEVLDVADIHMVGDDSLIALADHCPDITMLNIQGWNKVTETGMSKIAERCRSLHSLDLSYCSRLQSGVAAKCLLSLSDTLRELSLCGVLLQDEKLLVSAMCRLRNLKQVHFCGVPALNDTTMEQILSTVGGHLEEIDLSGSVMSTLTDAGLKSITTYCVQLQILGVHVGGVRLSSSVFTTWPTYCAYKSSERMTRLQHTTGSTLLPMLQNTVRAGLMTSLHLSCTHLAESVVWAVSTHCVNLETLDMCSLEFVDDSLLLSLAQHCHKLTDVNFRGCRQVTDVGVCTLACYCPLTSVVLSGVTHITDKSVFALANSCPYLEELHLNGCTQVSRVALTYLVDCCIPRVHYTHRVPNLAPEQLMARNLDTGEFCRADLMHVGQT